MPLHQIRQISPGSVLAVWKVEEEAGVFEAALPQADQCPEQINFMRKRLEWLGGRFLINYLFTGEGLHYQGLAKEESGKPFPIGLDYQISLSHSFPFIAAQIHPTMPVGIDLEILRPRMAQVIPRVLSPEEQTDAGNDPLKLGVYWSAKEALYKIYGKRNLIFSRHLLVEPFILSESGILNCSIIFRDQQWNVQLDYISAPEFILASTKTVEMK
ncbi:MAG: 4'-phosphopantetheinyl transferase family protein [Cyclobacteriaceae bacterium]